MYGYSLWYWIKSLWIGTSGVNFCAFIFGWKRKWQFANRIGNINFIGIVLFPGKLGRRNVMKLLGITRGFKECGRSREVATLLLLRTQTNAAKSLYLAAYRLKWLCRVSFLQKQSTESGHWYLYLYLHPHIRWEFVNLIQSFFCVKWSIYPFWTLFISKHPTRQHIYCILCMFKMFYYWFFTKSNGYSE